MLRLLALSLSSAWLAACTIIGDPALVSVEEDLTPAPTTEIDFEAQVRPILEAYSCLNAGCHGGEGPVYSGNLDARTVAALLAGGDHGPAVVPCDPDESPLVTKLADLPPFGLPMPLIGERVPEAEQAILRQWVAEGAGETYEPGACGEPEGVDFEAEVVPILEDHGCLTPGCHGGEGPAFSGHFDARTAESIRAGGGSGSGVLPCQPDESRLIDKVSGMASFGGDMPPVGFPPLEEADVELLRLWVSQGAEAAYDPATCGSE